MKEIWKDIVDYEGLYQVSNFGRVKSLWFGQERIMKPYKNKKGYLQLILCKEGKQKHLYVHRLVAQAFIDNPDNLPEVNHRDENKENNRVENLEWCNRLYNCTYGTARERITKAKSKTVYQYTLDGEFVREWSSTAEVQRQTGWKQGNISTCCIGKRLKSIYGFRWSYTPQENT